MGWGGAPSKRLDAGNFCTKAEVRDRVLIRDSV